MLYYTQSGNTPLHLAIQERRTEVVSYFINECKMDTAELDKVYVSIPNRQFTYACSLTLESTL